MLISVASSLRALRLGGGLLFATGVVACAGAQDPASAILVTVAHNGGRGEPIKLQVIENGKYVVFDESTGQVADGTVSTEQLSVARQSSETMRALSQHDCGSADFSACQAAVDGYVVDARATGIACFAIDSMGSDCPTDGLRELIVLYDELSKPFE